MNNNWRGILKVLHIQHFSKDKEVLWEARNLYNLLHTSGEEFILRSVFYGGPTSPYIPTYYYFGLDARSSLTAGNTMSTILSVGNEPSSNGYTRQSVSSTSQFNVAVNDDDIFQALSPIISFQASGGSWGPVKNLFLTDKSDASGFLIASVALPSTTTLNDGEIITMRLGLALRDCP